MGAGQVTDDFGITPELVELVKRAEGWRSAPYICPAGYPTIGYGHVIPSLAHPPISLEEGELLLKADLRTARKWASRYCPGLDNERRLAALVDFTFNLGGGRLKTSTLRRKVNAERWEEAGDQLNKWVFGGGRKLAGLVARRAITSEWMKEG